jgi:hypothetical protein
MQNSLCQKDRRLLTGTTQGRQANDTVREKRKKYEPLCDLAPPDKRLFFTPFVLESTGYLHEDAVNLLNLLLATKRTAEIWKISETGSTL